MELRFYGTCTLDQDGCSTCQDLAVPVRVVALNGSEALVEDRLAQRAWTIVDFVPDAKVGDILLVHAGLAIGRAREEA
ncbi:MAG: HypC/HybG/HupF family hydrogenase formation chaperone [Thermaerobacter sp.]|nr:HypC/HybG/HupF family hydrogenase formation chaperone [Thermaerobacter sp.]